MDNFLMEFTADGKYLGLIHTEKQNGSYKFDADKEKLLISIITNEAKTDSFTVKWEKELLTLTNNEGTVKLKRQ
jgi:hypothetical protein